MHFQGSLVHFQGSLVQRGNSNIVFVVNILTRLQRMQKLNKLIQHTSESSTEI